MPIGINRQNDFPIGGAGEFRGNMDTGAFSPDEVAVWDGEKFVPGPNVTLVSAYGGLAGVAMGSRPAETTGIVIDNWNTQMPTTVPPKAVIPNSASGLIQITLDGVYQLTFNASVTNLANNIAYDFRVNVDGFEPPNIVARVTGANQVDDYSVGFTACENINAGQVVGISLSSNLAGQSLSINSATLVITRLG